MARPFVNLPIKLTNPDGSTLDAFGWGDQYYARFETPDGFTVVRDPDTGFFHYAERSDAGRFIPTRVRATLGRGRPEGISAHLREDPRVVRAKVRASSLMNARQRWRERRAIRRAALKASAAERAAPPPHGTIGNYVGLCLLVQFPDVPAAVSAEEVTRFCNEEGYSNFGNNGSVYDYFLQNSMGRLRYKNQITTYYTAKNPRSYYTDPSVAYGARAQELIREALDSFVAVGADFSQLSRDSAGFIYALNVFYAGPTANNWAEGLWPHSSGIYPNYELADGSRFCDYQITNTGYELSLGTFCHENGHMLCDFPDLYDYGYESVGDGNYCLMAYGGSDFNPVNVGAYLKHAAGWASNVFTLSPGTSPCLSAERNDFVLHRKPGVPTEYYIIENRQQSGRDASLPDSGLAIWHVDELGSNDCELGSATEHYECALIQADGRSDLEHATNYGDDADLFAAPSSTRFSDDTQPAAHWWDGTRSGVQLAEISTAGATMSFVQQSAVVWRSDDVGHDASSVSWQLGDVNGDKQQELLQLSSRQGQLGLTIYGWSGEAVTLRWTSDNMGEGSGAVSWQVADINGDGQDEIIQCWNNHGKLGVILYGWRDNAMRTLWRTGDIGQGSGAVSWQVADINGDGRAELIQCWDNHGKLGVIVYAYKRHALTALWASGDLKQGSGAVAWQVADLDGDGRTELIQLWNNHGRLAAIVYGWTGKELKTRWASGNLGQGAAALSFQVADIDGDGRKELIQLWDNHGKLGVIVYGFRDGVLKTLSAEGQLAGSAAAISWQVGETDGDRRAELIQLSNNAGHVGMTVYGWRDSSLTTVRSVPDTAEQAEPLLWMSGGRIRQGAGTEILQLNLNAGQLGMVLYSAR